ncbi:hypothetical protein THF5G08_450005 [Vibrio jasicida]|nr:hypothetical protein THF5G08_450005 [Vibrio jasicida]
MIMLNFLSADLFRTGMSFMSYSLNQSKYDTNHIPIKSS